MGGDEADAQNHLRARDNPDGAIRVDRIRSTNYQKKFGSRFLLELDNKTVELRAASPASAEKWTAKIMDIVNLRRKELHDEEASARARGESGITRPDWMKQLKTHQHQKNSHKEDSGSGNKSATSDDEAPLSSSEFPATVHQVTTRQSRTISEPQIIPLPNRTAVDSAEGAASSNSASTAAASAAGGTKAVRPTEPSEFVYCLQLSLDGAKRPTNMPVSMFNDLRTKAGKHFKVPLDRLLQLIQPENAIDPEEADLASAVLTVKLDEAPAATAAAANNGQQQGGGSSSNDTVVYVSDDDDEEDDTPLVMHTLTWTTTLSDPLDPAAVAKRTE